MPLQLNPKPLLQRSQSLSLGFESLNRPGIAPDSPTELTSQQGQMSNQGYIIRHQVFDSHDDLGEPTLRAPTCPEIHHLVISR